jgi:hypothetical protein
MRLRTREIMQIEARIVHCTRMHETYYVPYLVSRLAKDLPHWALLYDSGCSSMHPSIVKGVGLH